MAPPYTPFRPFTDPDLDDGQIIFHIVEGDDSLAALLGSFPLGAMPGDGLGGLGSDLGIDDLDLLGFAQAFGLGAPTPHAQDLGNVEVQIEIRATDKTTKVHLVATGKLFGVTFSLNLDVTADEPANDNASTSTGSPSGISQTELEQSIAALQSAARQGMVGSYYYIDQLESALENVGDLPADYIQRVLSAAGAISESVCSSDQYVKMGDLARVMREQA